MANRKRDKFIEKEGRGNGSGFKPIYIIPVLVVIGVIAFFVMGGSGPEVAEDIGSVDTVDNFYISISKINDGKAHFYKYESNTGKTIRFFVLKSKDGVFRTAFDACDVCYNEKKGYSQQGDYMICNNCGRRFASTLINVEKGGCNPAPLDRTLEEDYLVIKKSDIEKGAIYF